MPAIRVRNYVPGETLPAALATGYEQRRCDPQWIWLAVDNADAPVAILVAAPAHIAVILMRLVAVDGAPVSTIRGLVRHVLAECAARGYLTYVTWVNPQRPAEASLLRLICQTGGKQLVEPQVCCIGLTEAA
jgi:hypothetical protein